MRAFVTGGTGFLGSNLVAELNARGMTARVLRRKSSSVAALDGLAYESSVGDVLGSRDALAAAMEGCAWVFHTAAVSDYWRHRTTEQLYRVNVEGTRNVLAASRMAGVERFVYTSSLAALGTPPRGRLLDETSQFNLKPDQFPYGHSKHLAEVEVRRAAEAGLAAVIVNPSVVLGPRDVNHVSGSLIREAVRGRLRLAPPGGVNFVAVEDVVSGHIAAAESGRVGERYVLAGDNLSYRTAFATVCEVVGVRGPAAVIPGWALPALATAVRGVRAVWGGRVPVDAQQVRLSSLSIYADGRKAAADLALPHTPFRTAVQRTYDWYRENGHLRRRRRPDFGRKTCC